ncbi:CYFA0S02e10550g1_1 [Cyberlindnera fabianii]|uniref:CYFA0S02e10550g1_1 n=1 Tax=Cyberlindnera fabianii TaxID=36022 RepID=A0A061ANB9_CYBFA|nr:CYFA0S02e10550g1_1 [Cyberlindnera fabianii]
MSDTETPKKYGHCKLVLLGDSAVGKSSLVQRFTKNTFDELRESTIGAAFITKTVPLDSTSVVKFEIWDTAGQERYKSLAPMYYRNADAALVVFDITDPTSFEKAKKWVQELRVQAPETLIVKFVGNKIDLKDRPQANTVEDAEVLAYCKDEGVEYLQCSAKTGENVSRVFELIAEDLPLEKFVDPSAEDAEDQSGSRGVIDLNRVTERAKSCSC